MGCRVLARGPTEDGILRHVGGLVRRVRLGGRLRAIGREPEGGPCPLVVGRDRVNPEPDRGAGGPVYQVSAREVLRLKRHAGGVRQAGPRGEAGVAHKQGVRGSRVRVENVVPVPHVVVRQGRRHERDGPCTCEPGDEVPQTLGSLTPSLNQSNTPRGIPAHQEVTRHVVGLQRGGPRGDDLPVDQSCQEWREDNDRDEFLAHGGTPFRRVVQLVRQTIQ